MLHLRPQQTAGQTPKEMTHQIIPLTLSQSLKETGIVKAFAVSKSKVVTNLIVDLNGKYSNKKVISTVNRKSWQKTHQALKDALTAKSVVEEHISLILDELDNNNTVVLEPFNGNDGTNDNEGTKSETNSGSYEEIDVNNVLDALWRSKKQEQNITLEEWSRGLSLRYDKLKGTVNRYFPTGWNSLEVTLAVQKILNIYGCTLPLALWILGRSGGNKTLSSSMFIPWLFVYYTRKFNPKAFVTHNTALKSEEELRKIDLLPRIRYRMLLVPELAPIFSVNEDELKDNIGIITSVLDGKGHVSDSGAHGQRGYNGDYMFTWVGATANIPYKVLKHFSQLGPKVYIYRLPFKDPTDEEIENELDQDSEFEAHRIEVQKLLMAYLIWFELCPLGENNKYSSLKHETATISNTPAVKIQWDESKDDLAAKKYIPKFARLLSSLRTHVDIWSQKQPLGDNESDDGTAVSRAREYSEYSYVIPNPEEPTRCAKCIRNLTRGKSLSLGRNHIEFDDLDLAAKVMLSAGSHERVATLDLLLSNSNNGTDNTLTLSTLAKALTMSKATALRTMTELAAVGIVDLENTMISGNPTHKIRLKKKFEWLYDERFQELRGDYTPVDRSKFHEDERVRDIARLAAIWSKFAELEAQSSKGYVELNRLIGFILNDSTTSLFEGPIDIEIFVKKMKHDPTLEEYITEAPDEPGSYVRERHGSIYGAKI